MNYMRGQKVRRKSDRSEVLVVIANGQSVFDIVKHERVPAIEVYSQNDLSETPFKISVDAIELVPKKIFREEIKDYASE